MGSFKKYVRSERGGREGGTLKAYENVKGEGVEAKRTYAVKIANSACDFSHHIGMIKQVSNLLISWLASSTHLLAGLID